MITQAGRWVADAGAEAAGAVVWLDGLSPGRFTELARVPLDDLSPGVRVLATLDSGELEGLRIPEQLNTLLDRHAVRVRLGTITEQERRDLLAEESYAALRPLLEEKEDLFLGRLMVAWEPLRAALARGGTEQATDHVALLRAVTDCPRLIDLQDVPGGQRYAPHPLLTVIADDPREDVSWPVSDVLWS